MYTPMLGFREMETVQHTETATYKKHWSWKAWDKNTDDMIFITQILEGGGTTQTRTMTGKTL